MQSNERVQEAIEKLKQQRDELRLKMHLAKADARDEWDEMEGKWDHLRDRLKAAGGEASEAKGDVGDALKSLASEIKKGYERIRDQLQP